MKNITFVPEAFERLNDWAAEEWSRWMMPKNQEYEQLWDLQTWLRISSPTYLPVKNQCDR
ncbi:MAG: hypothetical protein KME17_13410 [Cyanosarcina radialis HA8281-LM2]|nr:hypothetical protein [Cyanosarcina radialis HA8281-LM2]